LNHYPAISLFLLGLSFTACLPPAKAGSTPAPDSDRAWGAALRALDPADAPDPAFDIIAAYLHQDGKSLLVRVDLLDFQAPEQVRLEILVADAAEPGSPLYSINTGAPDELHPMAFGSMLDTVTVEIENALLPADPVLDVITPQDELRGLRPDGPVPPQAAPVLLAFYDTFAGRFPAEALRSWDGAHSGPRGERHGLKHLLDAVETYGVPVVLLDLKQPESLSALDAMGALPRVRGLAEAELLVLPEVSAQPADFDLPPGQAWFRSASIGVEAAYHFQFIRDTSHIYRFTRSPFQASTSMPVPVATETDQPTRDGPSLELRRALLEVALDDDPANLLALGGSLAESTWGASNMVAPTLAYFASRPYIRALSEADLLAFPARAGEPTALPIPTDDPTNALERHYDDLTAPVLEFAETWDGKPYSACGQDLDQDDQPECILADENLLGVLDPQGARLVYLFSWDRSGLHQLVGPSWQVAVGLSDPTLWHPELGEAADPGAYPGAFAEVDEPFMPYTASLAGDRIVFVSEDGARTKTFRLTGAGLEVTYRLQEPATARIALLVDPWVRTSPGWAGKYFLEQSAQEVRWGLQGGPLADLQAPGPLDVYAFNEGLDLLGEPEDPDYEYPQGF
jgi:hypothetical protein